jgi:type I restriction enzyme S subunit
MAITEKKETKFKDTKIGLLPEEWDVERLSECAYVYDSLHATPKYDDNGSKPMVRVTDIREGYLDLKNCLKVNDEVFLEFTKKYKPSQGDIVMSRVGSYGISSYHKYNNNFCLGQNTVIINSQIDSQFLYYALIDNKCKNQIEEKVGGSTQKTLSLKSIRELLIPSPDTNEQKAIAEILSSLDEKIELNRRMNKTLEEMGKTLFKRWFVDFEFPNEDGKPYKSSGGKMVDSELGEIPEGWKVKPLENFVEIFDSKRVPLSSREREACQGTYPYYGATQAMDYVNDYLFDGIYLLVAEDGTVKTSDSKPVTQYVWGKFWVNNHAHIIQGTNGYSTEAIKIFLDNINIDCYITGAVQPKINQSALRSIPVISPCKKYLEQYNSMVLFLFDQLRLLTNEINSLEKIKSSLLPKLISGRIRVEGELCKA